MKLKYLTCQLHCLSTLLFEYKVWHPMYLQDVCSFQMGYTHSAKLDPPSELVDLWIGLSNWLMIICACLIINTIQVCKVYQVAIFLLSIRSMTKWLSFFVIPIKYNDDCSGGWLTILSRTRMRYIFSWLIDTSCYNPFEVSLLFILILWR